MAKHIKIYSGFFLWLLFVPSIAQQFEEKQEIAKEALHNLKEGKTEQVFNHFDDTMQQHLSADQLSTIWKGIIQQYGAFENVEKIWVEEKDGYDIVIQQCSFKHGPLLFNLTFDSRNKIAGMFFKQVPGP